MCSSHMVSVTSQSVACNLAVNASAARQRLLFHFQQEHRRTFTRNHTLAMPIKRLAKFGRNGAKTRESCVRDTRKRVCSPSQHVVGFSRPEQVTCMSDRVVTGRAGSWDHNRLACQS